MVFSYFEMKARPLRPSGLPRFRYYLALAYGPVNGYEVLRVMRVDRFKSVKVVDYNRFSVALHVVAGKGYRAPARGDYRGAFPGLNVYALVFDHILHGAEVRNYSSF